MYYWDDERTSLLKILLEQGLSAQNIADTMNGRFKTEFTRAAIIGRANRIKAKFKKPVIEKQPRKRKVIMVVEKAPPPPEIIDLPVFLEQKTGITMLELNDDTCRWPLGESPPYLYCGKIVNRGSYCAGHAELSYTVPDYTKRNRR